MTDNSEELRDSAAEQVDRVSGTNSGGEETSVDELADALGRTHLVNLKAVAVTENSAKTPPLEELFKSKAEVVELPAKKGYESWFDRGQDFRDRPLTPEDGQHLYAFTRPQVSRDVVVNIRVGMSDDGLPTAARHVLFSGQKFDELTSCYGPAVKNLIRKAIADFFEFHLRTQEEIKKDGIINKYHRFLGEGKIYLTTLTLTDEISARIMAKDRQNVTSDSVLVKIGCTSDLDKRRKNYEQDAERGCCITIPGSENYSSVCFPFLLESILQQVFTFHQVDIPCPCKKKHIEIFHFDRLPGENDEDAFKEATKTVKLHIDKWAEALSSLTELHEAIRKLQDSYQQRNLQPLGIQIVK
ncbi:hypothetical protein BGZ99_009814, partial [Dissophora globulifera]